MSLEVDFVALAEGVASDSRGSLTLVAVNPPLLVADQLPAQFTPVLVAIIVDTDPENPVITAGRTMTGRIEAVGPDDSVLFVAQLRQPVSPPSIPLIRARAQIIAQVPFMAAKPGDFKISARMAVVDANENVMGEVIATREIKIADAASLRPAAN